ncbi:MAG: hypothetical protein WAV90_26160 [Gordonia amarae]
MREIVLKRRKAPLFLGLLAPAPGISARRAGLVGPVGMTLTCHGWGCGDQSQPWPFGP